MLKKLSAILCATAAFTCLITPIVPALTPSAQAQQLPGADRIAARYTKTEVRIPMRDGVTLFTAIYAPRDRSQNYPLMLMRTPYGCPPYGEDRINPRIGPSAIMENEGYIFVHQDVRGRWMSEGTFDNMRPHVDNQTDLAPAPNNTPANPGDQPGNQPSDESDDTFDTIQWLINNVDRNNGKVGMWGISYPGFYTTAALPQHHPALVCCSPQAPISDFFFDDFHHHGAYLLSYLLATNTFGYQHQGPSNWKWYTELTPNQSDPWKFYLDLVPLTKVETMMAKDNQFWQQLVDHPNYDSFWQQRNILPYLKNVKAAVLTVGGLFDAEDLYGPLNIYRSLEQKNPNTFNALVMGPWSHGDWSRRSGGPQQVGDIKFGNDIALDYQTNVEAPFFNHYLKGGPGQPDFEALMFDTGTKQWKKYTTWPPENAQALTLHLANDRSLSTTPQPDQTFHGFTSDPLNPVPYREKQKIKFRFTPRPYMTDDQRFATARDDVLTYQTTPLTAPLSVTGDLKTHLRVSTSQTDADWVVKLIDVYPDDYQDPAELGQRQPTDQNGNPIRGQNGNQGNSNGDTQKTTRSLGGYQQMVRSEVIRGRFRNSYQDPQPFTPGKIETVDLPLQDVHHTFKPGHRIMIQIQSTWFPLIDRNPQKYVDNIFKATLEDYTPAEHRVYIGGNDGTTIELKISP